MPVVTQRPKFFTPKPLTALGWAFIIGWSEVVGNGKKWLATVSGPLDSSKGVSVDRFRGGFPATIDAKGRVKLPARLREQLEVSFGREVYICSFFPHELRIYPLPVWQGVEERLLSKPTMKPAVRKLIERVNYGQLQEMDDHGRMLVPALLREMVEVEGEVVVSGRINHLAVTNRSRAVSFLTDELLSDDEQNELADLEL
jgi:transcriptional regulator MraZ